MRTRARPITRNTSSGKAVRRTCARCLALSGRSRHRNCPVRSLLNSDRPIEELARSLLSEGYRLLAVMVVTKRVGLGVQDARDYCNDLAVPATVIRKHGIDRIVESRLRRGQYIEAIALIRGCPIQDQWGLRSIKEYVDLEYPEAVPDEFRFGKE